MVITFDDGTYDFYKQAWPLLQRYNFPATVYQTTYYSDRQMPIFNLMCSYMLWKRRRIPLQPVEELGIDEPVDLSTEAGRFHVVSGLVVLSEREKLSGQQRKLDFSPRRIMAYNNPRD